MATEVFHARDVTIKAIAASSVTIGSNTLSSYFTSGVTLAKAKEVSITRGDRDFEQQNYHGEDANGFQNMGKVRSPNGPGEMKVTIDNDNYKAIAALVYDSSSTINTSYTRYTDGNANRKMVALLVMADDGSDYCAFAMDDAELTSTEDASTGADGILEKSMTFKCLAKDLYGPEFK
jgi:hypothetical protein